MWTEGEDLFETKTACQMVGTPRAAGGQEMGLDLSLDALGMLATSAEGGWGKVRGFFCAVLFCLLWRYLFVTFVGACLGQGEFGFERGRRI